MDFGLAFSFVFKDPDWLKKIAILALVGLIPIVGQLVIYGWMMDVTRRVMNQDPTPLPDLDFGTDLSRGFMGFVIGFVYSLPVTLIGGVSGIFSSLVDYSSSSVGSGISTLFSFFFGLAAFTLGFFIWLVLPAAITRYLENDQIGAAFEFSEVFKMVSKNLGAYFIVLLGSFVAGLIAPLGLIACIIGVVLTSVYSYAVIGHFYGQAYNEANKNIMIVEVPPTIT